LAAEALAVVAQADPGKMNYKKILNIKEPPIGGSFINYIFGNTAVTIATSSVSPFCFLALIISPSILKLK
jgi:hypothetical protein